MKRFYVNLAAHIVVLTGILVVFYIFVFSPQRKRLNSFDRMVEDKVLEIEESLDALGEITGESSELSSLRQRVEVAGGKFVPYELVGEAALELANWARRQGFDPIRVVPPVEWNSEEKVIKSSSSMDILEIPVVIEMRGTYLAYGRFLETLGDFPYHAVAAQMSITSTEPGKGSIVCSTEIRIYALRKHATGGEDRDEA